MQPIKCTQQPITVGATVVGLKYKDGVMMASDTLVSYGSSLKFDNISRITSVGKQTLLGAAGEYSDFQYLQRLMAEIELEDWQHQDGAALGPKQVASFLGRVLYNRRSKNNPLWNQLVIGGTAKDGTKSLHYVDLQGTCFEEDYMANGFGLHMALPILRKEWKPDMSEDEARALLKKCLELMFYRECTASIKIQIAKSTAAGVEIGEPFRMETYWGHETWSKTSAQLAMGAGGTW